MILADAINAPLVLVFGVAILVPLLLFEVIVEAWVLKRIWKVSFSELCRFTLIANCWSLLAGIPIKILNAWLYSWLLPGDFPGFFANYSVAVVFGSLIYFLATIAVEGACAFKWLRREEFSIASSKVWQGILLANIATYLVLAPLHFYVTKPKFEIGLTEDIAWSKNKAIKMLFIDPQNENLKVVQLDGSPAKTIIPAAVKDYLVSSDFKMCLFRSAEGKLFFYRQDLSHPKLIWETKEHFLMDQVAFSPEGKSVVFVSREAGSITIVDVENEHQISQPIPSELGKGNGSIVAWSTNEQIFLIKSSEHKRRIEASFDSSGLKYKAIRNDLPTQLLKCYGRVSAHGWWNGGSDWGSKFSDDQCEDLKAWAEYGLGSRLRIYNTNDGVKKTALSISVNPGLLHLSRFYFEEVAFLPDCDQCVFDANRYCYLLDISEKKVGTIVRGERFVLLTPRYQKTL